MPTNPAFLTFPEYLRIINPESKRHPGSAYSTTLGTLNSYDSSDNYPELLQQFESNGRVFEIRQKTERVWDRQYVKSSSDGEILRDEKGDLIYYTTEELQAQGKPEFEVEHIILDKKTQKIVGKTQNEWGCLLVMVAEEYQGMGLGPKLTYENRCRQPERPSGGMTHAGESTCFRAYQRMVSEHLTQGKYREALLNGDMSFNDIAKILYSADAVGKYVEKKRQSLIDQGYESMAKKIKKYDWGRSGDNQVDLDMTRATDLRLYADDSFAILYNARLLTLLDHHVTPNMERYDDFMEEGIVGYAYVGGTYDSKDIPKLFRLYGNNDNTRSLMAEVMLNTNLGLPVRIHDEDIQYLRDELQDKVSLENQDRTPFHTAILHEPSLSWLGDAIQLEKRGRKEKDNPYGENWVRIQELAYGVSERAHEKFIDDQESNMSP